MSAAERDAHRPTIEELVARMRGRIKAIFALHGIPRDDADDLLQEIFLGLVRRWADGARPIRDPEGWLTGAAYMICRSYHSRRRRSWLEFVGDAELARRAPPLPPAQLRIDQAREVESLLAGLKPRAAQRLWLVAGLGFSAVEVAAKTASRPEGVRKSIGRSLRKLRARA